MGLFKQYIIKSSIEIEIAPEEVWNFFYNIEANYKNWHLKDHNYFHWTKGRPLEIGSKFDSEETVDGHKVRIKGTCVESVKSRKIAFKPSWPVSFMCPKIEWIIEPRGDTTIFTAQTHYKFGKLFLILKKGRAEYMMDIAKKHMDEEGENLRNILVKNRETQNLSKK